MRRILYENTNNSRDLIVYFNSPVMLESYYYGIGSKAVVQINRYIIRIVDDCIINIGRDPDDEIEDPTDETKQLEAEPLRVGGSNKSSRNHCLLKAKNGQLSIIDISKNGTFVNDNKIAHGEECALDYNDSIRLASQVSFKILDKDAFNDTSRSHMY